MVGVAERETTLCSFVPQQQTNTFAYGVPRCALPLFSCQGSRFVNNKLNVMYLLLFFATDVWLRLVLTLGLLHSSMDYAACLNSCPTADIRNIFPAVHV
ncbi:hypothetical protein PM082_021299 [Marasmius tenuissimus]|nr:hypothetical protein PM082_021299 [Marasmius tenuissimus]